MYSRYRLAQKYLHYYFTAANGKGHGIHSPFVFDFVLNVLNDRVDYPDYADVEGLRGRLRKDRTLLEIEDLGAGSAWKAPRQRSVGDITRHAAKAAKLGQLLYRVARYYRPVKVVELGTSLGFSTAYLAAGVKAAFAREGLRAEGAGVEGVGAGMIGASVGGGGAGTGVRGGVIGDGVGAVSGGVAGIGGGVISAAAEVKGRGAGRVWSIEGSGQVAAAAERNLVSLGLEAKVVVGNFDLVLPGVLEEMGGVDLAFVDGNHRREPTLAYFNQLMERAGRPAVLIFDDIHWSAEMEEAWEIIKNDPRVYLTIDLFFIGFVFLREEFKVKQDFVIRF